MKPLRDFWLGGYQERSKTYIAFEDPIESLKPKLIHVREVGLEEKTLKQKREEKYESIFVKCSRCKNKAMTPLKVCKECYLKEGIK